jgi:hypothetical protein
MPDPPRDTAYSNTPLAKKLVRDRVLIAKIQLTTLPAFPSGISQKFNLHITLMAHIVVYKQH